MVQTEVAIADFPKIVREHTEKSTKTELEKIVDRIETVKTHLPSMLPDNRMAEFLRERSKVLQQLVNAYFIAAISQEFPLIDEDLFKLQRSLILEKKGSEYEVVKDEAELKLDGKTQRGSAGESRFHVKVPLFSYTELFAGNHESMLGSFKHSHQALSWNGSTYTTSTSITFEAKLPGTIGPEIREAHRNGLGQYHIILGNAYQNPALGDIVSTTKLNEPEMGAIWIPTEDSLIINSWENVIRPRVIDPALVISAFDRKFLVKTWTVEAEEPFEHFLREYTTGILKGRI